MTYDFSFVLPSAALKYNLRCSRLKSSPLLPYLLSSQDALDYDKSLEKQAEVFEKECSATLSFALKEGEPCRTEDRSLFIIKLLLFIGVHPNGNHLAVLTAIIECLSYRQDMTVDDAISYFASTHGTTVSAVTHIIEKCLNIYNAELFTRVEYLTGSQPFTPKDIICDLALYINLDYTVKQGVDNEQYI